MAFLQSIQDLRGVEFSRSYLWDIKFPASDGKPGAPFPFNEWFPATSVDEPLFEIVSHTIEIGCREYKFPKSKGAISLTITFLDSKDNVLEDWLSDWADGIFPENGSDGVRTLEDSARKCQILKLNIDKTPQKRTIYDLYPEGPAINSFSSSPELKVFTVSFVVVGHVKGSVF